MKNRLFCTAALLAVPLALGPAALAQTTTTRTTEINTQYEYDRSGFGPEVGDWEFTLGGAGTNDRDFDNGIFSIDASVGNYVAESLLVGLRQNVSYSDTNNDNAWAGSSVGFVQYHFAFEGAEAWQPFIGGGFGALYGDGVKDTLLAGPEAGLKWYAKDEVFVFGRVAYQWLFNSGDGATDNFDDGRFVYSLGVGFNF